MTGQASLFDPPGACVVCGGGESLVDTPQGQVCAPCRRPRPAHHDGETYEPDKDHARLGAQLQRVYDTMIDGRWRTLADLEAATGDPQSSLSARLRDLRKHKFTRGIWDVERRRVDGGLFEYRMTKRMDTDLVSL